LRAGLGFSRVLLNLVLVFAPQNLAPATTAFSGVKWTIPLGLDLLLASLLGGVIAILLGAARVLQLRRCPDAIRELARVADLERAWAHVTASVRRR
jgi:uncharacterized integral membrane protein